jgi:hypothetical protein
MLRSPSGGPDSKGRRQGRPEPWEEISSLSIRKIYPIEVGLESFFNRLRLIEWHLGFWMPESSGSFPNKSAVASSITFSFSPTTENDLANHPLPAVAVSCPLAMSVNSGAAAITPLREINKQSDIQSLYSRDLIAGSLPFTIDDVRRELIGKDLVCWCRRPDRSASSLKNAATGEVSLLSCASVFFLLAR